MEETTIFSTMSDGTTEEPNGKKENNLNFNLTQCMKVNAWTTDL